jgi:hypothetical protein
LEIGLGPVVVVGCHQEPAPLHEHLTHYNWVVFNNGGRETSSRCQVLMGFGVSMKESENLGTIVQGRRMFGELFNDLIELMQSFFELTGFSQSDGVQL